MIEPYADCRIIHMQATAIPPEEVLAAIGGESSGAALQSVLQSIEEANVAISAGLATPMLISTVSRITAITRDSISLAGGFDISCSGPLLQGATHLAIGIGTIGPNLEHRVQEVFASGDPLAAVVLDTMGTILLRRMTGEFRAVCARRAEAERLQVDIGPRLAPGCHAIPIESQAVLFSLLDARRIGVTLSSSFMMSPLKSVSVMFPMGPTLPERLRAYSMCDVCVHREKCETISRRTQAACPPGQALA
ncbi:MAG: vitamin B12 dependent-methionine synthase activation domain-containing protein [Clostridia bacterium]|nr:vitamin B12 dependent-methionine synthase activation domain-containing protein [Clostridia bacterium]